MMVLMLVAGSTGLFMLLVFVALRAFAPSGWTSSSATTPEATADRETPGGQAGAKQLELLAYRGSEDHGFMKVEGQVRNVSGESQQNVMVVITWYTDSGQFVKTDSTLIEYNPILAGQTSPFSSLTPRNPEMKRFDVEFKSLMGGSLSHEDLTK